MGMLAKKLKSRRGMSILMGLLLMLVCMTAGAAALTAAASNVGRYTHLRRDQQRYLAVSSAVRLVRDELCAGKYEAKATLIETYTYRFSPNPDGKGGSWRGVGHDYSLNSLAESSYAGEFDPWLKSYMDEASKGKVALAEWWDLAGESQSAAPEALKCEDLSLQVDSAGSEPLLSQVKWELTMDSDYNLTANFWLEETDKAGKVSTYYTTTLTIPAKVESSASAPKQEKTRSGRTRTEMTTLIQNQTVTWPTDGAVIRQM